MKTKALVVVGGKKSAVHFVEEAIARYPWAVNPVLQGAASLLSPFDHSLRIQLLCWESRICELRIPKLRRLRDLTNRLHPGVVGAFGERAAFLLIHRNFPFWNYSAVLQEIQTVLDAGGAGVAIARCELSAAEELRIERAIREKGVANIQLKAEVRFHGTNALAAHVRTSWRLEKRTWIWDQWKR